METKYECPFCGSDEIGTGFDGDTCVPFCDNCGAQGHGVATSDCSDTDMNNAILAFCTPRHFAERVKAELVPVAVAKTEAERLRDAAVGDVVTLDDGRRVKAELVPVAVAKTEAERLRDAAVGDVVTLDDGRRVRVENAKFRKDCCGPCVFSEDDEACNAAPCFIDARPTHRDSVYFEEVCDGE